MLVLTEAPINLGIMPSVVFYKKTLLNLEIIYNTKFHEKPGKRRRTLNDWVLQDTL